LSNTIRTDEATKTGYAAAILPAGVRSRRIDNGNGLSMHVLEAGFGDEKRPCVLLLHGFPELAYSWRRIMPALAAAGFYVVAPDQRGYGLCGGWDDNYDGDVGSFHLLNLAKDVLGLLTALGRREAAAVVGHDFGAPVAAWCALLYPEVFRSVILLSAPFGGPPQQGGPSHFWSTMTDALAALRPPRKHYQWYYTTRAADADMRLCPQGVHAFLRAYYHVKSADWKRNQPFALKSWAAEELAQMPKYYIMDFSMGMAQTVAEEAPTAAEISACSWLPEAELRVYSGEFARTGFQGGLQWYRNTLDSNSIAQLQRYSGRTIDVPCRFIAGTSDWGTHQSPGALGKMAASACTRFGGIHLVERAGHWVQQEQPGAVLQLLREFLFSLDL
jgi:pimeloyl-ACP methyl ester carboxylesterase